MRTARVILGIGSVVLGLFILSVSNGGSATRQLERSLPSGEAPVVPTANRSHDMQGRPFPFSTVPSIQAITVIEPNTVLAGSFGMGLFRSEDRGQTWVKVREGLSDDFILALTTAADGTVYAGTVRAGIFRSRDQGRSWNQINEGLKRLQIKALLATKQGLYAGTGNGVYRFNGKAEEWVVVTKGLDDILVHCLAMSPDGSLYAGTSGKGIMHYNAKTSGWNRLAAGLVDHEGLRENFIRVLTVDSNKSIYAGTFDGGVFRSADGGSHWKAISRSLPNDSIRGIVSTDGGLFVATGRGVYKSLNEGGKWASRNEGLTEQSIQVLVATVDGSLYAGTNAGAFRSDDDGNTWVSISQGLEGTAKSPFGMFR